MTRELKLALIVGFSLVLVVTVLISDHLSKARQVNLAEVSDQQPALVTLPEAEQRGPAIPPPTAEPRVAAVPAPAAEFGTSAGPPAVPPVDIEQGRRAGTNPTTTLAGADPDRAFIDHVINSGLGQVVDRGATRDIIPGGPINPPTPAAPPQPPITERTHTVAAGDTLSEIARKYYGERGAWTKLAAANGISRPEALKEGTKIKLPPSEQITGKPSAPAAPLFATSQKPQRPAARSAISTPPLIQTEKKGTPAPKPERARTKYASYVVRKGDTVMEIARRHLGSPGRMNEVLRLNESVIEDEDSLQTGTVLRLPLS